MIHAPQPCPAFLGLSPIEVLVVLVVALLVFVLLRRSR
jgi:hypothetical protein